MQRGKGSSQTGQERMVKTSNVMILRNTMLNTGQERFTSWSESSKENGNHELQQSDKKEIFNRQIRHHGKMDRVLQRAVLEQRRQRYSGRIDEGTRVDLSTA